MEYIFLQGSYVGQSSHLFIIYKPNPVFVLCLWSCLKSRNNLKWGFTTGKTWEKTNINSIRSLFNDELLKVEGNIESFVRVARWDFVWTRVCNGTYGCGSAFVTMVTVACGWVSSGRDFLTEYIRHCSFLVLRGSFVHSYRLTAMS